MTKRRPLRLIGILLALVLMPPRTGLTDGAPITDPYVWERLEEGQQIAVVTLGTDGTAHTDLFASIVDYSEERHEFTFLVPLGIEAHDVRVQDTKGSEFDQTYTASLDKRLREDWIARQAYRDRVIDTILPGVLLLNGNLPGWLGSLAGKKLYSARPYPTIEGGIEASQVFETRSGRVAIYDIDESVDVNALITEEGLPDSVLETLEAARGQRLAIVTLVTNPEAGATPDPKAKLLRLWDVESGQEIPISLNPEDSIEALAFSSDGSRLGVATDTGIIVWDLVSDAPFVTIAREGSKVQSMALSPNGAILAIAESRSLELWNIPTATRLDRWDDEVLQELGFGEYPVLKQVLFSPDGRFIAVAGGQLAILDAYTHEPLLIRTGEEGGKWFAVFSPDGSRMAAASSLDGSTQLYDTTTWAPQGKPLERLPHYGMTLSPDGSRLALIDLRTRLQLWNLQTGELERELDPQAYLASVAFSEDSARLSAAGNDGTISVWDVASSEELRRMQVPTKWEHMDAVTLSSDGAMVALGYREYVSEEQAETGLRLSWVSTMVPDANGHLIHRYPLGTGKAWANPIPLTRVYVVAPPDVGFEVQAPVIGDDYSGFVPGKPGYPLHRIHRAPKNQLAYAKDTILTPEGQLWRGTYVNANPDQDVVITVSEPLALPPHYAPPLLAHHVWWMGIGVALIAWLVAWRYLMGYFMAERYSFLGRTFWRDSLYWLTIGPIRSLAFILFLFLGLLAGYEFAREVSAIPTLPLLLPISLLGHGLTAYQFTRWSNSPAASPAPSFGFFAHRTFWGFLIVVMVSQAAYLVVALSVVAHLSGTG